MSEAQPEAVTSAFFCFAAFSAHVETKANVAHQTSSYENECQVGAQRHRGSDLAQVRYRKRWSAFGAYCNAAHRDESHGYKFTAAMEWRKAAELLTAFPAAADPCWRKWEQLMELPRQLANPVGGSPCFEH